MSPEQPEAEDELQGERDFRALANSIPQLVWMADGRGDIFWYSDRWYAYTGTTLAEVQGWGWRKVHHPDHVDRVVERIRHAFDTGEPWEDTFPLRSGTGEYRWFLSRALPIRNAEGQVVRWFGTNTDITEQRQATEALRESEGRFRSLAEQATAGILVIDDQSAIVFANPTVERIFGHAVRDLLGRSLDVLMPADQRPGHHAGMQRYLATGRRNIPWEGVELPGLTRDGRRVPLEISFGEFETAGRRYFTGIARDITWRKRLEREREDLLAKELSLREDAERRREELEKVTESRAELIRGFSHDVRTPLSVADMAASLLQQESLFGPLTEKQRESVHRIRRSIRTSLQLSNDLLEVALADAGQIALDRVLTDVGKVAREVADDIEAQAASVGLGLDIRAPEGLMAETDPERVRQILGNLLSNAVKYAPHGTVTVDAGGQRPGGQRGVGLVGVCVTDTGPGIPRDKQETIFEEYTRLEPTAAQAGTGIGLAISRRMARLMGGDLTVDSEVGHGARFTLWLPRVSNAGLEPAAGVDC